MMTSILSLRSTFLLVCLVVSAVDVSCSYPSSARSRKTIQEETTSLEMEEPRSWRPLFYPLTPSRSLSPSQSFLNHIQRDQAQRVLPLRHGAISGTNNVVDKLRKVLHDGKDLEPVNSGQNGIVQSVRGDYVQKDTRHPQRRTIFRVSSRNFDKSNTPATLRDNLPHKHFPGNVVSSHNFFNKALFHPSAPQTENGLDNADSQVSGKLYIQELNSVRAVKPVPVPITAQPFSASQISGYLGSPTVPGTFDTSGNIQPVKTDVSQGGNVVTSSLHTAGKRPGSPVAGHPQIQIQWPENPLSKAARVEEKSSNSLVDSSLTQSEKNPTIGESSTSTNVKEVYGQSGSLVYPRSFNSGSRQPAPEHQSTLSQSASLKESKHTKSITHPFHRSANVPLTGGRPGNYSSNKIDGPQARSAFSKFRPGIRFGFFWNAVTKTMQNMPAKRRTAPFALAPNQSLRTKNRHVPWGKNLMLRNSTSALTRGPTGNYKLGKSRSMNTLFGFKGFQYQPPKILASTKNKDHSVLPVRDSINTDRTKNQYIGWRGSLGTSMGIKMGSVSRYPTVFKKYGFRPINREVPITDSPVPSIILTTTSSEPHEVQSMSLEYSLVSSDTESAHGESDHHKVQGSLEVVKSDTDSVYVAHISDSQAPRQHVSSTQNTIPGSKISTAFKPEVRFKKFDFGINKESHGFRSKQNRSSLDRKRTGETKPSVGLVEPTPPEIQPNSITRTATQSQNLHSGGPSGDTSRKSGDDKSYDETKSTAQYTDMEKLLHKPFANKSGALLIQPNGYADMGHQILKNKMPTNQDKDADLNARMVTPLREILPLSGPKGDTREHVTRVAFSSSGNVHGGPANVHGGPVRLQVQPYPIPTNLTRSRNPTGSVGKGKTFKGKLVKGQNVHSSSIAFSPPNDAASPFVLRLGERRPMRFKDVQFDDILGSASFSGVRQRGGSRPTVQPTANTFMNVSSHGGGALDRWLGSSQDERGNPGNVPLPPVPSNRDTGIPLSTLTGKVQENVRSMEGYFSSIKGGMGRKENPNRSYLSSVGSTDYPSGNPSQSEDLSEINYLRTSAGNLFFRSIKTGLSA